MEQLPNLNCLIPFNMIFKYLALAATFLVFMMTSCKTTKYSLANPPENTISLGDGGGFAGIETGYTLLENGQIFRYSTPGDTTELQGIKKKEAKEWYEKFKGLRVQHLDIEQPGNLYYFVRFTNPDIAHGITWGAADYNIRKDILEFYKSMRDLVKDKKVIEKPSKVDEEKIAKEKEKKEKEKDKEVTGW
jgi:hypothetical protein